MLQQKAPLKAKSGLKRTSKLKAYKKLNKKSRKKARQDYQLEKIRPYVLKRDNRRCVLCGGKYEELHHINFRSHGVDHSESNLACLCKACHDRKAHGIESKKYREIIKARLAERHGYEYEKMDSI